MGEDEITFSPHGLKRTIFIPVSDVGGNSPEMRLDDRWNYKSFPVHSRYQGGITGRTTGDGIHCDRC